MINFKEHDGLLFKMLEEPVPLTDDAELPVLVRLIQDDTMLGKANKRSYHPDTLAKKIICSSSKLTDDGLFMDGNYTYCYEIIGTLVEEGSADWALYQMMQGEKVCHEKSQSIMYCEHAGYIRREVRYNCVDHMSVSVWLNGADNTGWQIYEEPDPQHAKEPIANCENCKHVCTNSNVDHCQMYEPKPTFKVGDWVEHKESKEQATIRRIMSYGAIEIEFAYSTESDIYQANDFHNDFRKLSPSEVIVKIGCLSGTIGKSCEPACFLMWHSNPKMDFNYSIIRFSALDTQTRELVESLLEAQEEE